MLDARLSRYQKDEREGLASHLYRLRSVGCWGIHSRSRGPCGGHRCPSPCRARPAAWHTPGSNRKRPAPDSRRGHTGGAPRGSCTGHCTPGLQPEHTQTHTHHSVRMSASVELVHIHTNTHLPISLLSGLYTTRHVLLSLKT